MPPDLKIYIQPNIDLSKESIISKYIQLRNNLILKKEDFDSFAVFTSFNNPITIFKTFNKQLTLKNGLNFDNYIKDNALFYLLHPGIINEEENTTIILTKGTWGFFALINHIDGELLEKCKHYSPCNIALEENDIDDKDVHLFQNDFLFDGKKIGQIDSIVYNDFHYINIIINGVNFSEEDKNDIDQLMNKYGDVNKFYLEFGTHFPNGDIKKTIYNDIGKSNITFNQFKNHILYIIS